MKNPLCISIADFFDNHRFVSFVYVLLLFV